MNAKSVLVCLAALVLLLTMRGSADRQMLDPSRGPKAPAEPADLSQLRERGNQMFRSGRYVGAAIIYQSGYEIAKNRGDLRSAVKFLNNLGSARYQLFQHREAVKAYLEARDLARTVGDRRTFGALCVNLSSMYLEMADVDAAAQAAAQGLDALRGMDTSFKAQLLMQSARIRLKQKRDTAAAIVSLRDAVEAARMDPRMATAVEAQAWSELGTALLDAGNPKVAEPALLESFRLRKLYHDERIYYSYDALGKLRMSQGDARAASLLFSREIDSARRASPAALWTGYYRRGGAELAQGRLQEAFADFGAALDWMRRWRSEVLPADAFRVSSEVALHDAFLAYIELGSRLYRETGRQEFAQRVFAVTEESRTASLRALEAESENLTAILPAEYWETLARLHRAEASLATDEAAHEAARETPDHTPALRELRLKLVELETGAGLELTPPDSSDTGWGAGQVLQRTRMALSPDAVYLGFTVGKAESWLWVVARDGFELQHLPPEAQISEMVRQFSRSVAAGAPEATSAGRNLYAQLFGGAGPRLAGKRVWIMALDGPLFELPFAALVKGYKTAGNVPLYLVEDHALQITPGVWSLLRAPAPTTSGPFVGLGDPIYNSADPRFGAHVQRASLARVSRANPRAEGTELARLAGSDREIEQCARIWRSQGSGVIVLKGSAASKKNVVDALRRRPSVLHLAAHMIFPAHDSGSGMVALTLRPQGGVEFLSASEIAGMRIAADLVVLNGCSSAQGTILPGAGLMGMTRAWLAAGARGVIATRWPTPDDNTELFSYFYESLHSLSRSAQPYVFARALEQAQVRQLRAGGRYSGPACWGAYFCVARN
jgi:CHAT domain-containing protein/tetratricopeptide (TPR) repeat protein